MTDFAKTFYMLPYGSIFFAPETGKFGVMLVV